jgi:hypothetical protein
MKKVFNEYGVMIDEDCKSHDDKIYNDIRNFLKSNTEISIRELMILQRHYSVMIDNVFCSIILERQVHKRKEDREKKKLPVQ